MLYSIKQFYYNILYYIIATLFHFDQRPPSPCLVAHEPSQRSPQATTGAPEPQHLNGLRGRARRVRRGSVRVSGRGLRPNLDERERLTV